jgi:hypothetical protein
MNRKYLARLALLTFFVVPATQAQIKHVEMRVEGMT